MKTCSSCLGRQFIGESICPSCAGIGIEGSYYERPTPEDVVRMLARGQFYLLDFVGTLNETNKEQNKTIQAMSYRLEALERNPFVRWFGWIFSNKKKGSAQGDRE